MGKMIMMIEDADKLIHLMLEGTFSEEDSLRSMQAYQQTINPLDSTEYELRLDCTKLNIVSPEVAALLERFFMMFKQDGFHGIILTLEHNPILKMQLARLGRKARLDNLLIASAVNT